MSQNTNTALWVVGLGAVAYFLYKNKANVLPQVLQPYLTPCGRGYSLDLRQGAPGICVRAGTPGINPNNPNYRGISTVRAPVRVSRGLND